LKTSATRLGPCSSTSRVGWLRWTCISSNHNDRFMELATWGILRLFAFTRDRSLFLPLSRKLRLPKDLLGSHANWYDYE
jgi:hypothetical protein